jgi:pSer/pThr/pTyr-binding forkhead associated (FHA) protein
VPIYRLRYGHLDVEIPLGDFVVGRSSDCELILDDPLASRRHAVFHATEARLQIEDLGSRNGVKVNQALIDRVAELRHDDVVTIGSQDLRVQVLDAPARRPARRAAVTQPSAAPGTDEATAVGFRTVLIAKAFAVGSLQDAEMLLTSLMQTTVLRADTAVEPALAAEISAYALRLAAETGKAAWIDAVFQVHHAAARVLPAPMLDEVHVLARRVRYSATPALRAYLEWLQSQIGRLTPPERFVLQRLEGLVRVLTA